MPMPAGPSGLVPRLRVHGEQACCIPNDRACGVCAIPCRHHAGRLVRCGCPRLWQGHRVTSFAELRTVCRLHLGNWSPTSAQCRGSCSRWHLRPPCGISPKKIPRLLRAIGGLNGWELPERSFDFGTGTGQSDLVWSCARLS